MFRAELPGGRRPDRRPRIAGEPIPPLSSAATVTCNIPTSGSGDRSADHPYGLRGSDTSPNISASDPAAPTGPTGTCFRLNPIFRPTAQGLPAYLIFGQAEMTLRPASSWASFCPN